MASEAEVAREGRLKAMQMHDLGTERREYIFTSDRRSKYDSVSKEFIESSRASNIAGTQAYNLRQENADKISAWTNASKTLEQEDTEDVLQFKDGQSHRARLNDILEQDTRPDPWEHTGRGGRGGRGGKASTRARGGGTVGSRGRGGSGPTSNLSRQPPLTAQTTLRGRSTGPILATAQPIPASVMIGHHMVPRSSTTTQMNASVAADHARRARGLQDTQSLLPSTKTKTQPPPTRGGKAAPGGMSRADSLLDRALQLAKELKKKNLAPGSKGAKLQPAEELKKSLSPGSKGVNPQPASRPQIKDRGNLEPPPDRRRRSQSPRPLPGRTFESSLASPHDFMAAFMSQQVAKQEANAVAESNTDRTQRHREKAVQPVDSQTPIAPNVPRAGFTPPLEALPESDKPNVDLIDFDQEEGQTEFVRPVAGTWMQQDHGLLDLDNDVIHTQPILPKSSAKWQTDIATQRTPVAVDEPANLSDFEDEIRTLSSVLSHLTLSDDKEVSNLKLGLLKTMARLTREATTQKTAREVAAPAQSSRLDAPVDSGARRTARQLPKSAKSQEEDIVIGKGKDLFAPKALPSRPRLSQAVEFTFSVDEGPEPKSFGDFTTQQKSKTQQSRQDKTSQDRATKLDGLKTFSKVFTFDKPVPKDSTLLLGKDKAEEQPVVPRQLQADGLGVHFGSTTSHPKLPSVETIIDKDELAKALNSAPQESFEEPTQSKAKTRALQTLPPDIEIPATQPRLPQTQKPAIASSSNPEPLPPGRNLYYKANFSPLPAHDPRKVPYTFDSGLKLRPVIIGEHLLPGQGRVLESGSAVPELSPASAQHEPSPTVAPRQFKQTQKKFETTFEDSNPERFSTPIFGDGLLPGQRTRAQRPTNVFGYSSYLGAQVASQSSDLEDRDRAKRFQVPSQEPMVNASGGSLFDERLPPGVSLHTPDSPTNARRPVSLATRPTSRENSPGAPALDSGEPTEKKKAVSPTASRKGALKYSASQLMNIQAPVTLDSDRVSAIRRIISASMDKTYRTKPKDASHNVGKSSSKSSLKAVPVTTPVSTSRISAPVQSKISCLDFPNIPDNAMTRQYNVLGHGSSRAVNDTITTTARSDSDKESAMRPASHVSVDAGTNRRPAIFDSTYAATALAESNRSKAVDTEHNQRASATQAAPARHTSTYATERERYDVARVAARRRPSTRENAIADADPAPPANNPSKSNPFESFSRPAAAPTALSESFRTNSANRAALSARAINEKEFKPNTDAKKELDGVGQSIHASRWAFSSIGTNPTGRTFNNDGFMGRH